MSKREVEASHGQASGTGAQSRGESQSDLCGFEGAKPKLRSESESGNESGSGSEALRGSREDGSQRLAEVKATERKGSSKRPWAPPNFR